MRMGTLTYGTAVIEFDDRLLAHLQIVIVNKLRRRESFAMSWRDLLDAGGGRSAIWLDASIPLYFKFEGSRVPAINREWVERLSDSAASSTGLIVTDEDGESRHAGRLLSTDRPAHHTHLTH
jgi:hypothetical protein